MSDLIDRQAAIDAIQAAYIDTQEGFDKAAVKINVGLTKALHIMQGLPSAQPERKRGKWEVTYLDHESMGNRPRILYCSKCNQCIAFPTNYCPNCGAKMEVDG